MAIQAISSGISPRVLQAYISASSRSRRKQQAALSKTSSKTSATKSPSLRKKDNDLSRSVRTLDKTLSHDTELSDSTAKPLSTDKTQVKDVDYNPEYDMADARFQQAHFDYDKGDFRYQANPFSLAATTAISLDPDDASGLAYRIVDKDKFSHATLIEAIAYHHILFDKLPKAELRLSYKSTEILKAEQILKSRLQLHQNTILVYDYELSYHIKESRYEIYDCLEKKTVGQVTYTLVGSEYLMEEASGEIFGKKLLLDPIWKSHHEQRIGYQVLKIGHRRLDLTSPSKQYRKGSWSFKVNEQPVQHEAQFKSHELKKNHVSTKKVIRMGQYKLDLSLKFLNDCFSEPYAASGKITPV